MRISLFFCIVLLVNTAMGVCHPKELIQILDDIRQKIGDAKTDVDNRHWNQSLLIDRVNTVQEWLCRDTFCLEARISTPTVAEVREYSYNSDVIQPIRLAYIITDSNPPAYKRLERYSVATLDKETHEWENLDSDLPSKYYERGQIYGLVVKPSSVYSSTYAVQIDYYKNASTMTVNSDIPFDGELMLYPYHQLLVYGVAIMCYEDDGKNTVGLEAKYNFLLKNMKDMLRAKTDQGQWR